MLFGALQLKNDVQQKTLQLADQEKLVASVEQKIQDSRKGKEDSVGQHSPRSMLPKKHVTIPAASLVEVGSSLISRSYHTCSTYSRDILKVGGACRMIEQQSWQRCNSWRST